PPNEGESGCRAGRKIIGLRRHVCRRARRRRRRRRADPLGRDRALRGLCRTRRALPRRQARPHRRSGNHALQVGRHRARGSRRGVSGGSRGAALVQSAAYRRFRRTAYALGTVAFLLAFFHRLAPGAIAADLRATFDTSATALGFIAAFYFYPYAAMQLPCGVLADSIGPRRLFTAGCVGAGLGSVLFALAPSVAWLLVGRALVGLGVAVAFVSVLKLIASWYREGEFATWVGVLMLIGNVGGILATVPLAWMTKYISWRQVFLAAGIVSLVLSVCIWLWVRDDPADAGLVPRADALPAHSDWWDGVLRVARNRDTWPGFFMHLGMIGSYLTFAGLWAVPYLTDGLGLAPPTATLHVTMMILGLALGAAAVGTLSDRMGRRLPLVRALSLLYLASWLPWVLGWQL